ncbi:MAG TPA: tetratricopeptide repeat protein [Terriglobia bacterium]|nr:tetratricopeptide repeat protein [Terriglobia bacterium]
MMRRDESGIKQSRDANRARCAFFLSALLALWMSGACRCPAAQSPETLQKIQQLLQTGDTATAQALLSQALLESPNDGGLSNIQGVIKAQEGDFASAEANFRKAIELAPHLEGAYLNLGRLYQEHISRDPGAREKALGVYAELLRFAPDHLEANYQSAVLLMQKRLYGESLQRLAKLPAEAQDHSQALSLRCADYAGLGQGDKAELAADKLLRSSDLAEADVTSILPILASRQGTSLALKLLRGLEARQLASFDSLHSLGLLSRSAGRLGEARQALEAAAQLQPNSVPALLDLARVADDQKDYTGALGYLAHARELDPNNGSIHFFWGIVCIEQDLAQEAYQSLKKAVALDPQNAYYNYAMGVVTMQREDANEAIPYLKTYCELKPHDPRGRLALGAAYFNSHDDESAQKVLSAIAHDPQTAVGANFYLGRIDNREGRYPEALRHLKLALQARPDYADAYAELGLVYLKQREYAPAEEALEKALKLRPDGYVANLNLMILYQRTKNPKAEEQSKRFEQLKEERAQRAMEFLRTIEVRP